MLEAANKSASVSLKEISQLSEIDTKISVIREELVAIHKRLYSLHSRLFYNMVHSTSSMVPAEVETEGTIANINQNLANFDVIRDINDVIKGLEKL